MSKLFGYDFWFKNRTPRFPFGNRFGRHPYRNMYRLIASLALVVYLLISSNDSIYEINNAIKTAETAVGELPADEGKYSKQKSVSDMLNADKKFMKMLNDIGYGEIIKNQPKIVVYSAGNKNIEAYKDSSDWNTKFAFIELTSDKKSKSQVLFKNVCGEICIIDVQKKKYF